MLGDDRAEQKRDDRNERSPKNGTRDDLQTIPKMRGPPGVVTDFLTKLIFFKK